MCSFVFHGSGFSVIRFELVPGAVAPGGGGGGHMGSGQAAVTWSGGGGGGGGFRAEVGAGAAAPLCRLGTVRSKRNRHHGGSCHQPEGEPGASAARHARSLCSRARDVKFEAEGSARL